MAHDPETFTVDGPLGDLAGLLDVLDAYYALPGTGSSICRIHYRLYEDPDIQWEGEPWWGIDREPAPARRLRRDAPLYRFDIPALGPDIRYDIDVTPDIVTLRIGEENGTASFGFEIAREKRFCHATATLQVPIATDLMNAVAEDDLMPILGIVPHASLAHLRLPIHDCRIDGDEIHAETSITLLDALRHDVRSS